MVTIPRNEYGIRTFDNQSIERLRAIVHYRRVGMSLEDIRAVWAEFHNHQLSTELLEKTRLSLEKQIADLQETHHFLIQKIKLHRYLAEMAKQGASLEKHMAVYHNFKLNSVLFLQGELSSNKLTKNKRGFKPLFRMLSYSPVKNSDSWITSVL